VGLYRRDAVETGQWRTYVDRGRAEIVNARCDVQIPGILPGEYQLEIVLGRRYFMCYCPYDGEHFWMPGIRDRSESPWYFVGPDTTLALTCELSTEPARIEGRISGAWLDMGMTAVPELSIVGPDSVPIMGRRSVEADGSFQVDIHLPGPVKLLVTHDGLEQWIGGPSFTEATVYDLQFGQTISGVEFVQCGVQLFLASPNLGLGAAVIGFHDPENHELLVAASIDAGSPRVLGITNLWPGDYLLRISHGRPLNSQPAWRPQWFDRANEAEQARLVSITNPGQIAQLNLHLELGGRISGTILQTEGPANHVNVFVTAAGESTVLTYDYFGPWYRGYQVQGLSDGVFKVGACRADQGWDWPDPPPPGTIWYPSTTDWDAAGIVEILDAAVITDVDIAMD